MTEKRRVLVLIDGYNLYHGIDSIASWPENNAHYLKWVNLEKLVGEFTKPDTHDVVGIKYFTAYATWKREAYRRHAVYVRALNTTCVETILGKFKEKFKKCHVCGSEHSSHEEKETDVNIALHMLKAAQEDVCDELILITGDTDLAPAIRMVKDNFCLRVKVIAPPNRGNHEMRAIGDKFSQIKRLHLERCLFPRQITLADKKITRPPKYNPPDEDTD